MSVQPALPAESAIPISVVSLYVKEMNKCLDKLMPNVGFACLGKGGIKQVKKSGKNLEEFVRQHASAYKLSGDYLMITDGSGPQLVKDVERLAQDWRNMKDGLSDTAKALKWPPKAAHKPIPDGLDKRAVERLEKRRAAKVQMRQMYPIVVLGEKFCTYLYLFVKVMDSQELTITAPSFEEFKKLTELPKGLRILEAPFLLDLSLSRDLWVQRFVANSIAMFCIASDNVAKIGEQGMDKLVSLASVQDEQVQVSCLMAAFKVAIYKGFHDKGSGTTGPQDSAMDVLKELAQNGVSAKVKALAVSAIALAAGAEVGRDAKDLADKAVGKATEVAGSAIAGVKSLFK